MTAPVPGMATTAAGSRSSFIGDLRTVLGSSGFRKLYATRLISQTGDGVFNAGLGAYVFFNTTSFPDPAAAATSFAVLYLPYSLIGPFAGVFIDRWSRRQIMLWSALLRAAFGTLTAIFIAFGALGLPVWLAALVVLGVNRFFLSSLSAALPHVVDENELVMGNSVGPTSGTVVAFIGGIAGLGVRLITGPGAVGSAVILLAAALCYLLAGLSATRITPSSLGPDLPPGASLSSVATEIGGVAVGLVTGLRNTWHRRPARAALTAIGAHRFVYGILLLMSILLYRNYFYPHSSDSNEALRHFLPVVISSAIGYGVAAWLTPVVTRRISYAAWITMLLVAGGGITLLGLSFSQIEFIVIGFGLGVVAQGLAICVTTILQQQMADDYRGRVFSVYDMLFNVTFVAGAAISAAFMPDSGRSVPMLLVVACGYVVAAVVYRLMLGQRPGTGSPASAVTPYGVAPDGAMPDDAAPDGAAPVPADQPFGSPDSRAQRSSS
jgi:MFS family permease